MEKRPNKVLTGLLLTVFTLLAVGLILLGQKTEKPKVAIKPTPTPIATPTASPSATPTPTLVIRYIPQRVVTIPPQPDAGQSAQPNNTTIINNQPPQSQPAPQPVPQPTQAPQPTQTPPQPTTAPLVCLLGICL